MHRDTELHAADFATEPANALASKLDPKTASRTSRVNGLPRLKLAFMHR